MASAIDTENKQLKAQINDLKLELEEKDEQMSLSGQLGNELLKSNNELNRQLEEIQESHLLQMEELRQENYSLKLKTDQEKLARDNFMNEMEIMKEKLQQDFKQELARQENSYEKKLNELQIEIDSLVSELEKNTLVNEQLHEKIAKQEEMLAEAHRYSKQMQGMSVLASQLEDLKEECTSMRLKKAEMNLILSDMNAEKEQLLFDKQNLAQKIDVLKENLEETSSQGKIWFDALQNSRQQLSELQMEISILKAEALNRSHKNQGNSLFGEVEDRRLELEEKFTAVSAKYKSLSTTHNITKKQLIELKTRIVPMLTMANNQADSSKIKRLEAALIRNKSEMQNLYVKIEELEKEKDGRGINTRLERFHDVFTDFQDKKDYVVYLQAEIKSLHDTIKKLKSKNEVSMMKLTGETDKRRQVESQLHSAEVDREKLKLDRVRLQLKMDELKMRLQQVENKDPQQPGSNGSKCSLWKDVSLFAKPNDVNKNECTNEKTRLGNKNTSTKVTALAKDIANSEKTSVNKSPAGKKSKPVGLVTPNVKNVQRHEQDETARQGESLLPIAGTISTTPVQNASNGEQLRNSSENTENRSIPRQDSNPRGRTVKPRRVIHVKKDAPNNECKQQ